MKGESIMRNFVFCLSYLLLTLVTSSGFADVILKNGKVVKVGRDVVEIAGKIRITDCTTGEISEYEQGIYEYKKGRDCRTSPAKKKAPEHRQTEPPTPSPDLVKQWGH
jgi:hypothetical protein